MGLYRIISAKVEYFSHLSYFSDETTEQIARKIKEFLIENKISQRMLAENLLNMKQANLSPLLCNPKPWKAMTPIIRNRFIVMHLWLNDENRIEKINVPSIV